MRRLAALAAAAVVAATSAGASAALPTTTARPAAAPGSGTVRAKSDSHVARHAVSARVARALGPSGEMRGMALNDQSPLRPATAAIADFPRMAADGITSVAVYVYLYVDDPTGTVVTPGLYTPTDSELQLIAQAARANGLGLQVMPVLLDRATNTWRGRYQPSDVGAFFASYTTQVLRYADLAQSLGASLFYVGSEQRSLERFTSQWTTLIASVRHHFSGALTYLAIPSSATNVHFFDRLDLASVSPYFSLGDDPLPTYQRDVQAWKQTHLAVVAKIVRTAKVPVIYGEVGYNSQKGAFENPPVPATKVGSPAPAAQADAYAALLDVLAQTAGVYGVTWWRWSPGATTADMTYAPDGKPAECVIAAHWSTDPVVLAVVTQPVCDLHALDAVFAALPVPHVV